jgi:hypothetical protein
VAKGKPRETKLQHLLELSDEILSNFETDETPFEKILLKCKRLARLRDDIDALKWFTLELFGFREENMPLGISEADFTKSLQLSGRSFYLKDPPKKEIGFKYWTSSVTEIEATIETNLIALQNLKPPEQFTPAITRTSYDSMHLGPTSNESVVEKYQDVLNSLNVSMAAHLRTIQSEKGVLSKIKNNIYSYVMKINQQLKFENITESVFQKTKENVDKMLFRICPDAMKNFLAAYGRLESNNPAEWSQALSSCRNVLKDFADYVFPAQKEQYELCSGEKLDVTDDKYKNRLLAFIDGKSTGNKGRLLKARFSDLSSRIRSLHDLLSQGTHDEKDITLLDVNICVIDTYLLIGSMLSFTKVSEFTTSS